MGSAMEKNIHLDWILDYFVVHFLKYYDLGVTVPRTLFVALFGTIRLMQVGLEAENARAILRFGRVIQAKPFTKLPLEFLCTKS